MRSIITDQTFQDLRDLIDQYEDDFTEYLCKEVIGWLQQIERRAPEYENENVDDRQAVVVTDDGFVVTFDGETVFRYIGKRTAFVLPTLQLTPVTTEYTGDQFELSLGEQFWAVIKHGCNGGQPFVFHESNH